MATISGYIDQVHYVREQLLKYRNALIAVAHTHSSGAEISSSYDVWINLCLVTMKIRPAFLIRWTDYIDPDIFRRIMEILCNYRDNLRTIDLDYRLLFLNTAQGIIVTTYYSYYRSGLNKWYGAWRATGGSASEARELLNVILGYPKETDLDIGDDQRFIIYSGTYGIQPRILFAGRYSTAASRDDLYKLYLRIVQGTHLYDSDAQIYISDSAGLLYSNVAAPPNSISTIKNRNISEVERNRYTAFINSGDRQTENWNTDFDRVFELGYLYKST